MGRLKKGGGKRQQSGQKRKQFQVPEWRDKSHEDLTHLELTALERLDGGKGKKMQR